ncbi:MAG: hypothetical protein MUE51_10480 [Thermoleophilia bacterium]|jgi:hypothetical protein|nr:hypothetical protein [Thermoleophilia bacterium]
MRLSRPRALVGIAAASVIALGVAGCGGGETRTETVTTATPATQTAPVTTAPDTTATVPTSIDTVLDTTPTVDTTATADTTAGTDTAVDTTGIGEVTQYLKDVQDASNALTAFGTALQNVNNPQQLESSYANLTAELDKFDEAIARMGGYTLEQAQLEAQRARLVAAGPALSDVLRRFLDAAQQAIDTNDTAPLQAILPEVAQEIQNFVAAAQG